MSLYKIAVIGDRESVLGFRALGLEVYSADEDSVKDIFKRLSHRESRYAIIYVTEDFVPLLSAEISAVADELVPAIIPIPSKNGSLGLGAAALSSTVERAVGANIL
ncbi:MAG: V-type ATP synthase subunit F [Oscillospiraceae bacterium]|nr:V-type ATP synthase subunit F [Oscillospiraceae bacterium]